MSATQQLVVRISNPTARASLFLLRLEEAVKDMNGEIEVIRIPTAAASSLSSSSSKSQRRHAVAQMPMPKRTQQYAPAQMSILPPTPPLTPSPSDEKARPWPLC